jgi:hypothetical protein
MQLSDTQASIRLLKNIEHLGIFRECVGGQGNDKFARTCHRGTSQPVGCDVTTQRMKILKSKSQLKCYRTLFKYSNLSTRKLKLG